MSDLDFLLEEDTKTWLGVMCKPSKLHPSYFRILLILREMNTSPSILAEISGIGVARIRQRLKQLNGYGYVVLTDTLSDKTQIWGLAETLRRPAILSHPSEALVQDRKSRQSNMWTEHKHVIKHVVPVPDGVVRPRNPAKVDSIDVSAFKQYEAKVNR